MSLQPWWDVATASNAKNRIPSMPPLTSLSESLKIALREKYHMRNDVVEYNREVDITEQKCKPTVP